MKKALFKLLAAALTAAMLLSAAACGGGTASTDSAGVTAQSDGGNDAAASVIELPERQSPPESYSEISVEQLFSVPFDMSWLEIVGMVGGYVLFEDQAAATNSLNEAPRGLFSLDGKTRVDGYRDFTLLSEKYGAVGFSVDGEDVNRWGIMDAQLNVVLEASAGIISPISDRFCMVITAVESIPESYDWGVRAVSSRGQLLGSHLTGDETAWYTCNHRIFDLEAMAFVPNVEATGPTAQLGYGEALDGTILLSLGGINENRFAAYDASGVELPHPDYVTNYFVSGESIFLVSKDSVYKYDGKLQLQKEYSFADKYVEAVAQGRYIVMINENSPRFISVYDTETDTLYDTQLDTITGPRHSPKMGNYIVNGYYDGVTGEPRRGIYLLPEFTEVISDGKVGHSVHNENGYLSDDILSGDGNVYKSDGTVLGTAANARLHFLMAGDDAKSFKALSNGAAISCEAGYDFYNCSLCSPFVYQTCTTDGNMGLIESINGTHLLPDEYEYVCADECFAFAYAKDAAEFEVYRINYK